MGTSQSAIYAQEYMDSVTKIADDNTIIVNNADGESNGIVQLDDDNDKAGDGTRKEVSDNKKYDHVCNHLVSSNYSPKTKLLRKNEYGKLNREVYLLSMDGEQKCICKKCYEFLRAQIRGCIKESGTKDVIERHQLCDNKYRWSVCTYTTHIQICQELGLDEDRKTLVSQLSNGNLCFDCHPSFVVDTHINH